MTFLQIVPDNQSTAYKVRTWLESFEGGVYNHASLSGATGPMLHRLKKSDFVGILGPLLGASFYAVLHPSGPQTGMSQAKH